MTACKELTDILDYLIAEISIKRVVSGQKYPKPPDNEWMEIYSRTVLDIPFQGKKHIMYGDGHKLCECILSPGEILLSPKGIWKLPIWDTPHKLLCLVFDDNYLRCTYVDYTGDNFTGKRPFCNCFFHTQSPPPSWLRGILNAMVQLCNDGDSSGALPMLAEALLRLSRTCLTGEMTEKRTSKAHRTYLLLRQYLEENFALPLSREETACRFSLSPAYISRLFSEQAGKSFSRVLLELRMEHAVFLLNHTELLIDEITLQCGYSSTPFFTSLFKSYHGIPPGEFRRLHAREKR